MNQDPLERRIGERRLVAPEQLEDKIMRPLSSESAIEHGKRLLENGVAGIEERTDGSVWAAGPDRRRSDRRTP